MKILASKVLFFFTAFCFSQGGNDLRGYVVCDKLPAAGIEVVNLTTEKSTISNLNGQFQIIAKTADVLIFYSKKHEYKKIVLNEVNIKEDTFIVTLLRKAEELDEVIVTNMSSIKLGLDKAHEQGMRDQFAVEKSARTPKVIGVNNGTIENGADLMRIGGMILGLFIKEKEPDKVSKPVISFKDYAKETFDDAFYIGKLNLKQEEIYLFLEFCDADPESKMIGINLNELTLMDFLNRKSVAFKKLTTVLK